MSVDSDKQKLNGSIVTESLIKKPFLCQTNKDLSVMETKYLAHKNKIQSTKYSKSIHTAV